MRAPILLALVTVVLLGQQPEVQQKTTGPCSVAIVGSNNQVFTCKGMDQKVAGQMLEILNRIASRQLDPEAVMAKLDEIQKGVDEIRKNTAPRALDDAAFNRIVTKLFPFRGQKAEIRYVQTGSEPRRLGERIRDAMIRAGWEVSPLNSIMSVGSGPPPDITIGLAEETPAVLAIGNALLAEGLSVEGVMRNLESGLIVITIYPKT